MKKTVKTKITIIGGKNLTNLNSSDIFSIQQLNKGKERGEVRKVW